MTVAQLIPLAIKSSIAILMFCIALNARFKDVLYLLGKPGLLVRSLLAMNLIMPLFALAVAPFPPVLPKKQFKAGGTHSYAIGLLAVAALASIVLVPVTVALVSRIVARSVYVSAVAVAWIVAVSILVPLAAGVVFRRLAPTAAERVARPLSIFAAVGFSSPSWQ